MMDNGHTETVFKEKHDVWDPMSELTKSITSPYSMSTPESTLAYVPWALGQPYATVDLIPQSGINNLASVYVAD